MDPGAASHLGFRHLKPEAVPFGVGKIGRSSEGMPFSTRALFQMVSKDAFSDASQECAHK
jgi:hypothetical protein